MKHGMTGTRFYQIWCAMKQRCFYPKHNRFKNYGARGITVCEEWMDFQNFFNDMYESYKSHCEKYGEADTSVDRVNSQGNYTKNNCIWNTLGKQNLNRTNNHLLTYKNETKPITQWAKEKGFERGVLDGRIERGWSIKKMLETKSIKKFSPIKKNTRKRDCPFCNAGSNSAHKDGCSEIQRLKDGKRVIKYSINEIITR